VTVYYPLHAASASDHPGPCSPVPGCQAHMYHVLCHSSVQLAWNRAIVEHPKRCTWWALMASISYCISPSASRGGGGGGCSWDTCKTSCSLGRTVPVCKQLTRPLQNLEGPHIPGSELSWVECPQHQAACAEQHLVSHNECEIDPCGADLTCCSM